MALDEMAGTDAEPADGMHWWKARRSGRGRSRPNGAGAGAGPVYGLGMIGAMAYFFQSAESGWDYVLAIPRASLWPALLVYKLLKRYYG